MVRNTKHTWMITTGLAAAGLLATSTLTQAQSPVASVAPENARPNAPIQTVMQSPLPDDFDADRDEWREGIESLAKHGLQPAPYLNRFDSIAQFEPQTIAPFLHALVSDLRYGTQHGELSLEQHQLVTEEVNALIDECDEPEECLQTIAARHPDYAPLQAMLTHFKQLAAIDAWPVLESGETLKPGMTGPRVAQLRTLLQVSGDLKKPLFGLNKEEDNRYTAQLEDAVKSYQARHGLAVDGAVGPNTLRSMQIGPAERAEQIALTLERMRSVDIPETGIAINVPDYHLQAFRDGREVLQMPVIVGATDTATPLFFNKINRIVVNPTWTPPMSIVGNELIPKLQNNPGYAYNSNFSVYDRSSGVELNPDSVDWYAVSANDVKLVQNAGNGNALGKVKFLMPDNRAIYLHDTSSPKLFSKEYRALSHGCVRVQDPQALMDYVLADQRDDLNTAQSAWQDGGDPKAFRLHQEVPVQMTYFTARVNTAGEITFHDDVYGSDAELKTAMAAKLPVMASAE